MKGKINKDFYCSCGVCIEQDSFYCPLHSSYEWTFDGCAAYKEHDFHFGRLDQDGCCYCLHRKHPTPEQFKEEYGKGYPDDGAVYCYTFNGAGYSWVTGDYKWAKEYKQDFEPVVCACTPWACPPEDYNRRYK